MIGTLDDAVVRGIATARETETGRARETEIETGIGSGEDGGVTHGARAQREIGIAIGREDIATVTDPAIMGTGIETETATGTEEGTGLVAGMTDVDALGVAVAHGAETC